jgi:hypothetical protein
MVTLPDGVCVMIKRILFILIRTIPVVITPQDKPAETPGPSAPGDVNTNISVLSQYSNRFKFKEVYFNRRIDPGGRGENLMVDFALENQTDHEMDLYIFIIASYEIDVPSESTFTRPVPLEDRIKNFAVSPGSIENFTYPDVDGKGVRKKNMFNEDMNKYVKFPKNPREGINPETGKPWRLGGRLFFTTNILSPYKQNYYFFNNAAILIFDDQGKPLFRQLFELKGFRR